MNESNENAPRAKLPNKPSDLIDFAMFDLEQVEQDPRYRVDMSTWHQPATAFRDEEGEIVEVCEVCLAGSVMAKSLDAEHGRDSTPQDFDEETANALDALDCFRLGRAQQGVHWMGLDDSMVEDMVVTPYERNRVQFREDMDILASALRGVGL